VNGDGFDDLLIGAPNADASGNGKTYAGDSYVIFGGKFGDFWSRDPTARQVKRISPMTFDGAGYDVTLVLEHVARNQPVEVFVGRTAADLRSVGTFVNTDGAVRWTVTLDIGSSGLASANSVAVVNCAPLNIASAIGRYPSVNNLDAYEPLSAGSRELPDLQQAIYTDVAKLFKWDFETERYDEQFTPIDWTKQTIILTHGWNDNLNLGAGDEYVNEFARDFKLGRSEQLNSFNILAVDWWAGGSRRGSDPNGIDSIRDELRAGLYTALADAITSASNGINAAIPLAAQFLAAGLRAQDVGNLMLIGHSNGAGFMASLAKTLFRRTGSKVNELVALDAPWATPSYGEFRSAAAVVQRVSNYYQPLVQSRPEAFWLGRVLDVEAGFGKSMFPTQGVVTNFELSGDLSDLDSRPNFRNVDAHNQVPRRYATTADALRQSPLWGFQASGFLPGTGPIHSGWVWKEVTAPGVFEAIVTPNALASETLRLIQTVSRNVVQTVGETSKSVWDSSVRVAQDLSDALKGVETRVLVPLLSVVSRLPLLHGRANSPVLGAIDVRIPSNTDLLTFDLSVLNPGNNDTLLVSLGTDVIGQIDLAAVAEAGPQHFELWVGGYAGATTTLNFYMPSDQSSTAEFLLSNIEFATLNQPPVFTSSAILSVAENQTAVITVAASDADVPAQTLAYSITGGADAGKFSITSGGVLTFVTAPNFEIPTDVGANNVYDVQVTVTDNGTGNLTDVQTIAVTVTNVSEPPVITGPASVNSSQRPLISWAAVTGATEYDIWVTKDPSTVPYHQVTVAQTSYTPPVDFGIGKFNLWVRAKNSETVGPWTPKYTFVINTATVLNGITRLQPTLRPTISWAALPGAVKYDVWINDVSRGITQHIRKMNVTGTTFTPSADLPLGIYRAWVRGIAADGTAGLWSGGVEFVTMRAPTITQGQNSTFDRTPTFAWNALPGAAKYEVLVRNRNTGATTVDKRNITGLSFTTPTLPDGPYRWWAIGVSTQGVRSFWTAPMDIHIGGRTHLLTPLGSTSDRTPTFTWRPVDGAVRYDLFVNHVGGQAQIIRQQNLIATSYTPTTSLPTGSYRAWIRAVSSTGEVSPWSLEVAFTITAIAPLGDSESPDGLQKGSGVFFCGSRVGTVLRDRLTVAVIGRKRLPTPSVYATTSARGIVDTGESPTEEQMPTIDPHDGVSQHSYDDMRSNQFDDDLLVAAIHEFLEGTCF